MAISMNWVKDYVNLDDVDLLSLARKITDSGVNVEKVTQNKFNNLVIGRVKTCENHPDSDHLHVCTVDVGTDVRQIVCGAPNVRKDINVIVSLPGAILPGGFEIKPSVIRGVESNGMICALSELGLEEENQENRKKVIYILGEDANVMLEYGQPLHFFDKDKLGDKIVVRMAEDGEKIVTLDGKERDLVSSDIVITDGVKPVCIAGVMGGENTDVDANTKDILIESAIFNSYNVRYTSLRLDLRSEASLRYERGLNYEYTNMAIERACHLLEKYADGKVLEGTVVYDNVKKEKKVATVTKEDVNTTLGLEMTDEDIKRSLENLGFNYTLKDDVYTVEIPNRRLDVEAHKQDLIEEIGRLYGYDKIVSVLPSLETKQGKYLGKTKEIRNVASRLRSLGLNECRTYTLVSDEENDMFKYNRGESIYLLKPMSSDKKVIRQSLIPSLLNVYKYNKARGVKDVLIYEVANTYHDTDVEDTKISILMKGNYVTNNWMATSCKVDFYLLKGIAESLLDYLGLKNRYDFNVKEVDSMHPGMTAEITLDREPIGFMGRVHPEVMKDDVYVLEISLDKLYEKKIKPIKYKEISKYPTVVKDLAFIIDNDVTSKDLVTTIKKAGGRILTDIDVFDVYKGENLDAGKKSIAYSLTFSDPTKTLSDEEVMKVFNKIIEDVTKKHNAVLRDK